MKPTARTAFCACLLIWIMILLPYFVPELNTLLPEILGLPFIVFWQYLMIALHIILCIFCMKFVWDPFDGGQEGGEIK